MRKRTHFYPIQMVGRRSLFCVFLVLICITPCSAQPSTPIEWGEAEIIYSNDNWPAVDVTVAGDTIVLHSTQFNHPYHQPALKVTGDGGLSWSPWHVFTDDQSNRMDSPVEFTSQGLFCITAHSQADERGLSVSTDLGWTWQDPCTTLNLNVRIVSYHDELYCGMNLSEIASTSDGGCEFNNFSSSDLPAGISDVCIGGGWLHAVTAFTDWEPGRALFYTRAPLSTGVFEAPREIFPDIYWTQTGRLECDEEGTVMILAPVNYAPPLPLLAAQAVAISRDYGATWTERDTLTPLESTDFFGMHIVHEERKWLLVWADSTTSDGFTQGGLRCAFSANKGRSWYSSQQVDDSGIQGGIGCLELTADGARIYYAGAFLNGSFDPFVKWEGSISPDETSPSVIDALAPPSYVSQDTLLSLALHASDDDSLWKVQFVACRSDIESDSVVVNLSMEDIDHYLGTWQVPGDTAIWRCYYRAEDMWENVSYAPEEGPASPWILDVGILSAAEGRSALPTEPGFTVYPNPTNGEVTFVIEKTRIGQRIEIDIFDLLGRKAGYVGSNATSGGTIHLTWNTHNLNGQPLPSGVYFAQLTQDRVIASTRVSIIR